MKILIYIAILLINISAASAQDRINIPHSYGISSNYEIVNFDSDFDSIPGFENCCPEYKSGNGFGFNAGAYYSYNLFKLFRIGSNLRIGVFSGDYNVPDTALIIIGNSMEPAEIEHELKANFIRLSFEPFVQLMITNRLSITGGIGINYLLSKQFEQSEILVKPKDTGTFENGRRIRNEQSGTINESNSLLYSLFAGISYEFPVNKSGTLFLAPGVFYSSQLNSVLKHNDWAVSAISFGLSLRYSSKVDYSTPLAPAGID